MKRSSCLAAAWGRLGPIRRLAARGGDESGAAAVEYVVLVGAVALVVGAALLGFGATLMSRFEAERAAILRPTVEGSF